MSQLNSATRATADSNKMDEGTFEQEQQRMQMNDDAAASPASAEASIAAAAAEDARAQRLARRSQMRDEAERDAPERERRRLEALAAKADREARRAAALAAQTALWRSFSPAQRLFADGIALCFGFLSLADFNSAAQACKGWREGAKRVPELGDASVKGATRALLSSILASPFHAIVSSFTDSVIGSTVTNADGSVCSMEWTPAALQRLHLLRNLKQLGIALHLPLIQATEPIQYPLRLQSVDFMLCCSTSEVHRTFTSESFLRGLLSCASLTRLTLRLVAPFNIVLPLLGQLKQLRRLSMYANEYRFYTADMMRELKTLPQLEMLELRHLSENGDGASSWKSDWMEPLLTEPHQLQHLRRLKFDGSLSYDLPTCVLLSSLHSLTALDLRPSTDYRVLPLLSSFPQLRSLSLHLCSFMHLTQDDEEEVDAAYPAVVAAGELVFDHKHWARLSAIVPHLAHCSLTHLCFDCIRCDESSLADLCASQPRLEVLYLNQSLMASLLPLSTLTQLRSFGIHFAEHTDEPHSFEQLIQCKMLDSLYLSGATPDWSESQEQQLCPPSSLLPHLQYFLFRRKTSSVGCHFTLGDLE